jgi:hypothetical protein
MEITKTTLCLEWGFAKRVPSMAVYQDMLVALVEMISLQACDKAVIQPRLYLEPTR